MTTKKSTEVKKSASSVKNSAVSLREETRAAIKEHQNIEKYKKILAESIGQPGRRGYVTTNYTLAKRQAERKRGKYITREEYERQQKALVVLEKTSQYLAVETDITTILEKIAKTVVTALGAKRATFWDFTPDRKGAFIIAAHGIKKAYIEHSRKDPLPIGGAWLGRAMSTGQAWATSDIWKDPVLPPSWLPAVKKENYHGLLCLPLMRGDEIIGGMCIYHKEPHEYPFFEIDLMTIVANQAATAVENARTFSELKTERNKTLAVIESLTDGVIMYDLEERVTLVNPKLQELLWISGQEIVGEKITEKESEKSFYLKNLYNISRLAANDYTVHEYTTEGPNRVVLQVAQIPVYVQQSKKIGRMIILHDITREKELELLKSSFVSTASHQMRTPLSGIRWSLQMLSEDKTIAFGEGQKKLIGETQKATEHLIGLVNDLLDASRIEEGRYGYTFKEKDVVPIIEKAMTTLKASAQKKNLNLKFTQPEGPFPKASFDASKFEIALQNVVDNAVKYSKDGDSVSIWLSEKDDELIINVKDNGIGIPEKDRGFIFTKFFRAQNAVLFATEGSGLGLYIAKNIVDKHNGSITFESEQEKGSTFWISLPTNPSKMPRGVIEGL